MDEMSVKRTPLKLGPPPPPTSSLCSPGMRCRPQPQLFLSPFRGRASSNCSFGLDPLSVSYEFNQSFPRNAAMKRSRRDVFSTSLCPISSEFAVTKFP